MGPGKFKDEIDGLLFIKSTLREVQMGTMNLTMSDYDMISDIIYNIIDTLEVESM